MLTALSIRDVVLIETLDLEFGPGLGVLTGETGAGKSILLDALGLALGMRADSGLVRAGQEQASVSVAFELPAGPSGAGAARARTAWPASRASRWSSAAWSRPTAAAAPSSTTSRSRPGCCASSARCWSRSTASMTIAACSTRAATAALLDALRPDRRRAGRGGLGSGVREAEARLAEARAAHEEAERDREWLAHAVEELDRLAPAAGRGGAARRAARRPCRRARGSATSSARSRPCCRARRAAWPSCARRRGGSTGSPASIDLLARGAGGARPGGDRGGRGRGRARPRARGARPSIRRGSRRPRRGCSRFARSPASIGSSRTRCPRWRDELRAQLGAIEAGRSRRSRRSRPALAGRARATMTRRRRR